MRRGRVNLGVLIGGLIVVIPLVVLLGISFGNDPHSVPSVSVGKQAPSFELEDLDGVKTSLDDLRGTPFVLNFWSTWCLPCKQEHPLLLRAGRAEKRVRFFGVIYQDEAQTVRRYLKKEGSAFSHLLDPGGTTAIGYGVAGVPETFFVDRNGVIVHKQVGPLDPATLQAKLELIGG